MERRLASVCAHLVPALSPTRPRSVPASNADDEGGWSLDTITGVELGILDGKVRHDRLPRGDRSYMYREERAAGYRGRSTSFDA